MNIPPSLRAPATLSPDSPTEGISDPSETFCFIQIRLKFGTADISNLAQLS